MKKVGIVGGLGPESTLMYYHGIIDAFKASYEQEGYPEIGIESLNLKAVMAHIEKTGWEEVGEFIAKKFEALRLSGADFGVIASNTPHIVFDEIQSRTFLPLQSIVDATLNYVKQGNFNRLCLLGTKITMQSDFYQRMFAKEGIDLVIPSVEEIDDIQQKIFSELEFGIIKKQTKNRLLTIINRLVREEGVQGVILGCTELPLIIKAEDITIECIDTARIHIAGIVELCRRHE